MRIGVLHRFFASSVLAFSSLAGCCLAPSPPPTAQDCVETCQGTQSICTLRCGQDSECVTACARASERCVSACRSEPE